MNTELLLVVQAFAVSSLSVTLTKAAVTDWIRNGHADLYDYLYGRRKLGPAMDWFMNKIGDLLSCPYCFSHYVALMTTWYAVEYEYISGFTLTITWFLATVGLAGVASSMIIRMLKGE